MFLNDQETVTNLLYYESIAKTVVRLIRKSADAPVTIGVHGDWGAGKSSVLKMLESALAKFEALLHKQSSPYTVHRQVMANRTPEAVRSAMLEVRRNRLHGMQEFVDRLDRASGALA